jgi:adenylate cyclase
MGGGKTIRGIRLVSGLVLLAFVTCHLVNLAIGMHSLAAMEAWRAKLTVPWSTGPGQWLLGAAALVHLLLGLYAVAARRSLTLNATDIAQLALGLAIPPLLIAHVIAMAATNAVSPGFAHSYGLILAVYWSYAPAYAFLQLFVVVIVWMHGAIGLYSWLVLKPVWRKVGGLVLPFLFAVPILALLGFAQAGQEVLDKLTAEPAWRDLLVDNATRITKVTRDLAATQSRLIWIYGCAVLVAFAILAARILRRRLKPIAIDYDGGIHADGRYGLSILEFSLVNDVAHAQVCGGRGRCGTCRVRIEAGAGQLSGVEDLERETLARVGADSGERLACQALVRGDGVRVVRVLPPFVDATAARDPKEWAAERPAAEPQA